MFGLFRLTFRTIHYLLGLVAYVLLHIKRYGRRTALHTAYRRAKPNYQDPSAEPVMTSRSHRTQAKPEWVAAEVIRLKAFMGRRTGCRKLADTFNRLHGNKATVGRSFVADTVKAHQYEIACLRREIRARLPRSVDVGHVWATDLTNFTHTTHREDSKRHHQRFTALGILDHGSRLCLRLTTLVNKRSWTLLGHLCLAIGEYGKPKALRTDNERVFDSFVFKTFLKLAGIKHQRIQTCAPWQNGRVERFFKTVKEALCAFEIRSSANLQNMLTEFLGFYNHARTHQNLNGFTPAEVWRAGSVEAAEYEAKYKPIKEARLVHALDGELVGYYIRR